MTTPDGVELIITVITGYAMSLAGFDLRVYGVYIIGVLIIWRFIMGIAAGEDPLLSAVITSEFASLGSLMPTVFTPEGWGNLGATTLYPHGNR
jgi:PHS family inorganic phosphate transporter-like MFS transporter